MTARFRAANMVLSVTVSATIVLEVVLLATNQVDALFETPSAWIPISTRLVQMFSFLTTLSNLIAGIVAVLLVIRPERSGRLWRVIRLDALLSITAIGLAFLVLFAPHLELVGPPLVMTLMYHVVNPLLAVATWLFLDTRRQWVFRDVLIALIWPAAYLVYVFARGRFVHWYPYTLSDVDTLGARAYLNGVAVIALFFLLGIGAWAVDRRSLSQVRRLA